MWTSFSRDPDKDTNGEDWLTSNKQGRYVPSFHWTSITLFFFFQSSVVVWLRSSPLESPLALEHNKQPQCTNHTHTSPNLCFLFSSLFSRCKQLGWVLLFVLMLYLFCLHLPVCPAFSCPIAHRRKHDAAHQHPQQHHHRLWCSWLILIVICWCL